MEVPLLKARTILSAKENMLQIARCFFFTLFQYQASNIMNSHKNVPVLNIHYQLRGGVVRVARVGSPWHMLRQSVSKCGFLLFLSSAFFETYSWHLY